jgi:hypothetical protein
MKEPHVSTLAIPDMDGHIEPMTTTHICELIDAMSDEERFFAAAYLQHLGNDADEQRKATLEARMTRMDGGRIVDVQQIR